MDRGFSGLGFNQGVRRVRFRLSWVLSRATFGFHSMRWVQGKNSSSPSAGDCFAPTDCRSMRCSLLLRPGVFIIDG